MSISPLQLALSGLAPPLVALQIAVTGLAPVTELQGTIGARRVEQAQPYLPPVDAFSWKRRVQQPPQALTRKELDRLLAELLPRKAPEVAPEVGELALKRLVVEELPLDEPVVPVEIPAAKQESLEKPALPAASDLVAEKVALDEEIALPVVPAVVATDTQPVVVQSVSIEAIEEAVAQDEPLVREPDVQIVAADLKQRNRMQALLAAIILYEQQT